MSSFIIRVKNNGTVTYLGPIHDEWAATEWVRVAREYLKSLPNSVEYKRARFNIIPLYDAFKSRPVQVLSVIEGDK